MKRRRPLRAWPRIHTHSLAEQNGSNVIVYYRSEFTWSDPSSSCPNGAGQKTPLLKFLQIRSTLSTWFDDEFLCLLRKTLDNNAAYADGDGSDCSNFPENPHCNCRFCWFLLKTLLMVADNLHPVVLLGILQHL